MGQLIICIIMKSNPSNRSNRFRISSSTSQRLSLKQITKVGLCLALLVAGGFVVFMNFANSDKAFAYVNGDYRSKASGTWASTTTWEKYNGSSWSAATIAPTSANLNIYIMTGNIVTVSANATVDQVIVNSGGTLAVNSGITLSIANGTGTDLDVSGIFKSAGTVSTSGGVTIVFQTGGKYQHNYTTTAGTIPSATWDAGSICEIIGYTSNAVVPSGLQSFSNFTWNCPSQANDINLNGGITTIGQVFTIVSTGTKQLQLASGNANLNVGTDYIQTGGNFALSTSSSASNTLTIAGNYTQSGGTFSVVNGSSATGTIKVAGNWSHTLGTITVGGNTSTTTGIQFNGSSTQTFISGGNVTGNIDFTVNTGSTLSLGTNVVGGRNFTLASNGFLEIGSTAGITSSGATGNIQSTGTRSLNASADYTYNGTSAQVTGNGLPSTINNLILNNSAGLTLTNTVTASNGITFTSGKITTGTNELRTTNNSTSCITGQSASNYVIGNLRRTVSSSGTYTYPVGTSSYYELLTVTLNSVSGFSNLLGSFTNANPINPSYPLTGIVASEAHIDSMLNYGYWTLLPNSALTGGNYNIKAAMKGYTNLIASIYFYPLLVRANSTSSWQQSGSDAAFKYNSGTLTANKGGLSSFGDLGIGFGEGPPILSFDNHTLISGVDLQVGAVYLVTDVGMGLDALIEVLDFTGGASISDVDNFTGSNGYDDAWQPFINVAANTTSSVGWKVTFKVGGTSTDTIVPNIIFAAIDVDGDGSSLKEFVTAYKPYSISKSTGSNLVITQSGNDFTATSGSFATVANIDTNHTEAMFMVNYKNVNNFSYRTGSITTGGTQVRQASLYFKSFFNLPVTTLPIELMYFNPKLINNDVEISWATASEKNNDYFTIERSTNGKDFEELFRKPGVGTSQVKHYYSLIDKNPQKGNNYYRLKQTDYDGKFAYFPIKVVRYETTEITKNISFQNISPNPFTENFKINFNLKKDVTIDFTLINSSGQIIAKEKIDGTEGYNSFEFINKYNLGEGIYFVNLVCDGEKITQKVIKN